MGSGVRKSGSTRGDSIAGDLLPRHPMLSPCAEPLCDSPSFGARCERHETAEDRERMHALDIAALEAAEAEEHWRAARLRVIDAERAAGVWRASPETPSPGIGPA
jgi:hypothetical protein